MKATIPLRVRVDRLDRLTVYFGTREQLLGARVISADTPLPGDPGTRKEVHRYGGEEPGKLCRSWRIPKGRFGVSVHFTEAEIQAADAEDARLERRHAASRARDEVDRTLARWPDSHDAFRTQLRELMRLGIGALNLAVADVGHFGGYTFDQDTREAVQLHLQAIRSLLAEGRTVFDPGLRVRLAIEVRAKAAEADSGFRSFLDLLSPEDDA